MLKISCFVSLLNLLIATDIVQCKPDYLFHLEADGWLKLHTKPEIWEEAFVRCHDEGAVLASPINKDLTDALYIQMSRGRVNGHIFLGTHDFYSKGDYVSVEGVPLSNMDIKWGAEYNGTDTGDCLTMSVEGRTYYSSCKEPLPFICYKKLINQILNECGTFDDEYRLNHRTGHCYKVHREPQTWTRAYKICASEGGHLVILNDEEETRIVTDMFPPRTDQSDQWERFHVGLGTWGKDRVWTTIHGERLEDVFNKWKPGQPDNYNGVQNRGALLWSGELDDLNGTGDKIKFVCEKSPTTKQVESFSPCTDKIMRLCHICNESRNIPYKMLIN